MEGQGAGGREQGKGEGGDGVREVVVEVLRWL